MLLLKAGLLLGAGAAIFVAVASQVAGYPLEVIVVRGCIAWASVSFVGFIAELVVVSTPVSGTAELPEIAQGDGIDETEAA